ncbi:MAG: RagB/SusD family nutrient uptake outer membrane protein [Sphingobacteriales bacterium]|nr:MAG: RagB/SusD family nutrient uptake outer membrane protein [Sphingobacteriales bacterium]
MKNIFKISLLSLAVASVGVTGCKKSFLDRNPSNQAATSDVFKTVDGAAAAVQGMHRMMYEVVDHDIFGYPSLCLMWEFMGEDFVPSGYGANWFVTTYRYTDARNGDNLAAYAWTWDYQLVNNANQILDRIDNIPGDADKKAYVKASALFYRAFAYYNLANCFMHTYAAHTDMMLPSKQITFSDGSYTGPVVNAPCVPIYTAATQSPNPRATVGEVYSRITTDLTEAIALFESSSVVRSDKSELDVSVAKGLYARVALVMQDWAKAATMAREARSGYGYMTSTQLYDGFTDAKNGEWMWGSIINVEQNGIYASFLSHVDYDMNGYAALGMQKKCNSQFLADAGDMAIDTTDLRRKWWWSRADKLAAGNVPYVVNAQRKFKAKDNSSFAGDFPMMRSSEMALIEAEALAQGGNPGQSASVLNDFVQTRNPQFVAPTGAAALVKEIWKQRRIELWGEGFRFFDLQRSFASPLNTNTIGLNRNATGASSGLAGGTMAITPFDNQFLFRITTSELNVNRIPQNP